MGPDGSLIGSHGSPVVHNGSPMGPVLFGCALVRMKALRQDIILDQRPLRAYAGINLGLVPFD